MNRKNMPIQIDYLKSLLFLLVIPVAISSFNPPANFKMNADPGKGFAVVELFTSEGCSSCPPADDAVGRLDGFEKNVYVLSFHVDYWNYLGWKDKFSDPSYSNRQQEYGSLLHVENIYTPQIVVNGKVQFLGSNETQLKEAISASLTEVPGADIQLKVSPETNHTVQVTINSNGNTTNKLNLALVQNFAKDFIQRGENKGKTLSHFFTVRDFKIVSNPNGLATFYLNLPQDLKASDCSVIAFLQNPKSGVITAAAGSPLP
jgi:hypothetical protein